MGKILPILLAVIGIGGGVGAGIMLRPEAPPPEAHHDGEATDGHGEVADDGHGDEAHAEETHAEDTHSEEEATREYVKLNNQFVVPVVDEGAVRALVVMSLSVEVTAGSKESVYSREPKLRDAFLQVLFDHANAGGFDGTFTQTNRLDTLRSALRESAVRTLCYTISDVLIADIVRQDV